jgi:hypothetical protein
MVLNSIDTTDNLLLDCNMFICDYKVKITAEQAQTFDATTLKGAYTGEGLTVQKIFYLDTRSVQKERPVYVDGTENQCTDSNDGKNTSICQDVVVQVQKGTEIYYEDESFENTAITTPFAKGETRVYVIRFVKSDWRQNADIYHTIYGQERKDGAWWNTSFINRTLINCTLTDPNTPTRVNGSAGFTIGSDIQIVNFICQNNSYLYYTNSSYYAIANDTAQVEMDVVYGNGTSYNPTSVWDYTTTKTASAWMFAPNMNVTVSDRTLRNNLTCLGSNCTIDYSTTYGYAFNTTPSNGGALYNKSSGLTGLPEGAGAFTVFTFALFNTPVNLQYGYSCAWGYGKSSGLSNAEIRLCMNNKTLANSTNKNMTISIETYGDTNNSQVWIDNGRWEMYVVRYNGSQKFLSANFSATNNTTRTLAIVQNIIKINGVSYQTLQPTNQSVYGMLFYNESKSEKFINDTYYNWKSTAGYGMLGLTEQMTTPDLTVASRTLPSGNQLLSNASSIAGYCNATSLNSTTVYYNYTWFYNGTVNTSGIFQNNTPFYGMIDALQLAFANESGFTDADHANDTDYATKATWGLFGNISMYWNYTNPANSTNVTTWQTKHGNVTAATNDTLPAICSNQTTIQLRITSNNTNVTTITSTIQNATNGSTFSNFSSGAYGCNWTNVTNAKINDSFYTTCTVPNDYTNTSILVVTGWNFNIPADATITGVSSYYVAKSASATMMQDRFAFLWNNSAFFGTNTTNSTKLGTGDTLVTHGGNTSLWGATLNPGTVNLPTFGVAYELFKNSTTGTTNLVSLNVINMTIYYNQTGGTNYSQSSKFCWNGSVFIPLGVNSSTTNNSSASDVYEQDVWFNTSYTEDSGFANGTEILVNNRTTDITTGNWTFGCNATDGINSVVSANSSLLNITAGATDSCSCPVTPANWTLQMAHYCRINASCNIPGYYMIYNGTGNVTYNNSTVTIVITAKGEDVTSKIVGTTWEYVWSLVVKNYTG